MKMTREDFDRKLNEYTVQKFIPAVTNPMTRFAIGMAAGSGALKLALAGESTLSMLGITGEDGLVDLDVLKHAIYGGFEASGGKLPINRFGIGSLDKNDADAFFTFMEAA